MKEAKDFFVTTLLLVLIFGIFAEVGTSQKAIADNTSHDMDLPSSQQAFVSQKLPFDPANNVTLQVGKVMLVGKSAPINSTSEPPKMLANSLPFHVKDQKSFSDEKAKANSGILQQASQGGTTALTSSPAPIPSSSLVGFDGLDETSSGFFFPPDVQLATGTTYVMEMVNLEEKIWTKTGTPISSSTLKSFFLAGSSDFLSDPKVIYDSISGRWFASLTDVTTNSVLLAVSNSGDPRGTWSIYNISFGSNCADQPILGISDDKVVVSANDFSNKCSGSFVGAQYVILDKNAMITGSSTVSMQSVGPDVSKFSIHPVQSLSSTSTLYMVSVVGGGSNQIQVFSITGSVPSVVVNITTLTIQTVNVPPNAQQLGTTGLIDTGDERILDAKWFQSNLWTTFADACVPSGDIQTRSCAHLVEISTAGSPAVTQDFRYGTSGMYYFYPALTVENNGNLDLIFGFSSSSIHPSLAVTGRTVGQTANTLIQPLILKSGMNPDISGRYGDYFGAAVDPSNPLLVWMAGEYHSSSSSQNWSSFIGKFSVSSNITNTNAAPGVIVGEPCAAVTKSVTGPVSLFDDTAYNCTMAATNTAGGPVPFHGWSQEVFTITNPAGFNLPVIVTLTDCCQVGDWYGLYATYDASLLTGWSKKMTTTGVHTNSSLVATTYYPVWDGTGTIYSTKAVRLIIPPGQTINLRTYDGLFDQMGFRLDRACLTTEDVLVTVGCSVTGISAAPHWSPAGYNMAFNNGI